MNVKQYEKLLDKYPDAIRFSLSNTANQVAYKGLKLADKQVRKDFTLRNKFVLGSKVGGGALKYDKSKPSHNTAKIESKWGSVKKLGRRNFGFMERQEDGFRVKKETPKLAARTSKNENKRIKRGAKRKDIIKVKSGTIANTIKQLVMMYKAGHALPGSSQLFDLSNNQYFNYGEGLYQFSAKKPPRKKSKKGKYLKMPNFRRLYYSGADQKKKRRAQYWMKASQAKIKKKDIEEFYLKNLDKGLPKAK